MNISLLLPSRGRPEQLQAFWTSALEHADEPDEIEMVYRLDDDDPTRDEYDVQPSEHVTQLVGPRTIMTTYWNECYPHATSDIFMQAGDDIRFRTDHWDTRILEGFAMFDDHICLVHGNDGNHGSNFCAIGFVHRRWVETLGYMIAPYFESDYGDTWTNDIANMLNRRVYLPDVYNEHMHPIVGKGEWDLTHRERLERERQQNPGAIYAAKEPERRQAAEKLRTLFGTKDVRA